MKKIISMLLTIFMVVGMLPTVAFAADVVAGGTCGASGASVNWVLDSDGVLTISGEGAINTYNFVGQRPYHSYQGQIESIVIEAGVTAIGNNAFSGCSNLKSLTIKGDLAKIGNRAFYSCTALKDITYYGIVAPEYNINSGLGNLSITVTVPENYPVNTFADLEVSKTLPSGSGEATLPSYAVSILQRDTGVAVKSIVSGGEVAEGAVHGKDLTLVFEITREGGTPDEVYFDYLTIGTKEYDFQDAECPITLDDLTVTIPGELVDGAIVVDTGIMVKVTVDMAGGYLKDTDIAKKMWTVVDGVVTLTKDYAQHGFGGWYNWNECFAKEGYTLKEITTNLPQHGPYNPPHDGPVLDADIALTLVWECEHEMKAVDNGDGTHTVTCPCGEEKGETNEHTYGDNHFCVDCEAEEPVYVAYYSLSLKGNIGVNYYMHIDESIADGYMRFTTPRGGEVQIPISEAEKKQVNGKNYYVFTATVAAKEMMDTIQGQYFYGETSSEVYDYTVKKYADIIGENAATNAEYAKMKPLAEAMLVYGAWAQKNFDYNAGNLPVEVSDITEVTAADLNSFARTDKQGTESAPLVSVSLVLKTETSMRLYFDTTEELTATMNGESLKVVKKGSQTYVEIPNISAKNLDDTFTITIHDGTEEATVSYSPMTYCYNVLNAAEGTFTNAMVNTAKALYLYNQAANVYFQREE